jgi:site-specific DNA-methyltransferase (adenine-specific)
VRLAAKRMEAEILAGVTDIETEVNSVYLGDSATVLSAFPDYTFDCCITDPPWLNFYDASLTVDARTLPVFQQLFRVLKVDAIMYVIVSMDDFIYYGGYDYLDDKGEPRHRMGALEKIGFRIAKTPVFWKKGNALSRRGVKSWEYDRDFETILVAAKGSPVLTRGGRFSAFKEFDAVPPARLIHKNEKPVGLIEDLLQDCSFENSLVVDPFGGSGVTAEACMRLGRKYVVCERDKTSYDAIVKRIAKVKEQMTVCEST